MGGITVDVVDAGALSAVEREAWSAFLGGSGASSSPFFSLDYVSAAARVAPGAGVAVVRKRGALSAFLPFQARGRVLQPLGAPMTDYHGLIAPEPAAAMTETILEALKAARYSATGWTGAVGPGRVQARRRMVAGLGQGYEAWAAPRRSAVKDKGRRGRALARDHGAPVVKLDDADPAVLEWLIAGKREQYRSTGQHDIFTCGWTAELLRDLWRERRPGFGLRVSTLRVGGRVIAAEASLRAGAVRHLWFPVYDRGFARYSPGALLLLEQLAAAPSEGVDELDFGPDVEGYKAEFADPAGEVFEGVLLPEGASVEASAPGVLNRLRFKAERRFGVIRACEPSWPRSASAGLDSLMALGRRRLALAGAAAGPPPTALVEPAVAALPLASL